MLTNFLSLTHQSDSPITIRTRKFITNRLLARRQFIVDVLHPGRPNVPKSELSEKLATLYKSDKARVVPFGFRTHFGGGRSSGFALIYDDEESQKKFEPRYRLVRVSTTTLWAARVCSFVDRGLSLVRIGNEEGQANAKTAQGAKEPCQKGEFDSHDILPVVLLTFCSTAPWYQEAQGCRAAKEGQIGVACVFWFFCCILHSSAVCTQHRYAVCVYYLACPPRIIHAHA